MLPISDFNYKLPRTKSSRSYPSSLQELRKLQNVFSDKNSEVCNRFFNNPPDFIKEGFFESDYKIENTEKTDFIGKVKLKILIVFAIILSSLFGAQIVIAGTLTADGKKLQEINEEAAKTESENLYLKSQIAQISSLSNLSQKANTLGFNKPLIVLDP